MFHINFFLIWPFVFTEMITISKCIYAWTQGLHIFCLVKLLYLVAIQSLVLCEFEIVDDCKDIQQFPQTCSTSLMSLFPSS